MDAANFRKEIRGSWQALERLGLQKTLLQQTSLSVDEEYRNVVLDPNSAYADVYRAGLSRSHYNFILRDYSYFQFSYFSEHGWRLAYAPNPWLTGLPKAQKMQEEWEALEEMGGLSHEDASSLLSEMTYSGAVPPIRFEVATRDYREFDHPAAHFHIGHHADNRWPSAISLGPLSFSLLVAKLYYPDDWRALSGFADGASDNCIEQFLSKAISETALVSNQYFSDSESRSFHFGRGFGTSQPSLIDSALGKLGIKRRAAS